MTEEREDTIFRTLRFYKDGNQKIHIKIISGIDKGMFRNGQVIDVNENRLIFADAVLGSLTYLLNQISEDIKPFKERQNGY